jgi:histidine kinase/histidine kinase/DNA gyrase B/HSP90-like ATPase
VRNATVDPRLEEPASARPGGRLAALGVWAFACFSYWAVEVTAVLISSKDTFWVAARWALFGVLPDCLLAPLALWYTRRVPWGRVPPWRFLLRHAAGGGLFVALSSTGSVLEFVLEQRLTTGAWGPPPGLQTFAWKGLGSLFVYATLCGIGNAVELQHRAARAEVLRAEAQLAALRARLNPHFILNLLHTLMGLVAREPAAAEAALERLGDVLRYALRVQSQGLDEVRLSEEWEFVDRYLSLERLRLGDRLRSRLEAEDGLLDATVPAFSLQPLVENAVRHAIAPRAEGGSIVVSARRNGSLLVLAVEDDGEPPERVSVARGEGPPQGAGIGLRLIRERLAALYGGAASLETGRSALGGFRAAVSLPLTGPTGSPA